MLMRQHKNSRRKKNDLSEMSEKAVDTKKISTLDLKKSYRSSSEMEDDDDQLDGNEEQESVKRCVETKKNHENDWNKKNRVIRTL